MLAFILEAATVIGGASLALGLSMRADMRKARQSGRTVHSFRSAIRGI